MSVFKQQIPTRFAELVPGGLNAELMHFDLSRLLHSIQHGTHVVSVLVQPARSFSCRVSRCQGEVFGDDASLHSCRNLCAWR